MIKYDGHLKAAEKWNHIHVTQELLRWGSCGCWLSEYLSKRTETELPWNCFNSDSCMWPGSLLIEISRSGTVVTTLSRIVSYLWGTLIGAVYWLFTGSWTLRWWNPRRKWFFCMCIHSRICILPTYASAKEGFEQMEPFWRVCDTFLLSYFL